MSEASRRFRQLLATRPYTFTSGVYSPIQAKIAETVGLECVYMSGYSCAVGHLARADLGFPTMTEMTTWARYITSVVDIPVIADADDGYGNALITMRTVEEYEKTGVAGIHIEDQRLPKRCGHLAGKMVLPREEALGKLRAALDARSDPDFFIIARTDAESCVGGSLEEAIERGKLYADAGADMVWPEFGTPDRGPVERYAGEFRRAFPDVPLGFNYSSSFKWTEVQDPLTFGDLGEMGYKYIFITLGAIHAAMYAEWNFLKDLAQNQERAQFRLQAMKDGHPTENHHKMGRFQHFQELEQRYLPQELMAGRYTNSKGFGSQEVAARGILR